MKASLLALAAVFAASSASAQWQTTTTNCQFVLGTMQCTSTTPQQQQQPQSGINWGLIQQQPNYSNRVMEGFERGVRMRQQMEQQQLLQEQQRALAQQQKLIEQQSEQLAQQAPIDPNSQALELHKVQSWEAAKMVSAGDCPGAEAYALSVGNLVLAKQVKDYCGPAK